MSVDSHSPSERDQIDTKDRLIEDLVKKVNTLTLDKNRLRSRLAKNNQESIGSNSIDGVECATSCEDDVTSLISLYRGRNDELRNALEYSNSQCTALASEMRALQQHYRHATERVAQLEKKLADICPPTFTNR